MANPRDFLLITIERFKAAGLSIWVFGGWAEELWQLTPARMHNDIDFLYPGANFEQLDRCIAQMNGVQEIPSKRFSHKRAILYEHVMIEFLLVQHAKKLYFTDFFSGRYHLEWPIDIFCSKVNVTGYEVQIASQQALNSYRQHHTQVRQAYHEFLQTDLNTSYPSAGA